MTDTPSTPEPTPTPQSTPAEGGALDAALEQEIAAALGDESIDALMEADAAKEQAAAEKSDDDAKELHHEFRRGTISAIRGEDVFVELAGDDKRLQGVVPAAQFDHPPRLGVTMDFIVDHIDEAQGLIFLSREGAISRSTWEDLKTGSAVEARVTATNKGGLELELVGRIRAFMPASQIDIHHVDDLEQFVGQQVEAVVQEIDRKSKKVLLSRRRHLEQQRALMKDKVMAELAVEQLRDGVVSSVVDFGCFVDIGGVDGLVHVSDMSYQRHVKPKDMVKVGDKVKVVVLKIEADKDRIGLGMKQVEPDPWDTVAGPLKPGDQVSGRITRTADFGAFVELAPGVEGLLPISELSWKRVNKTTDVVKLDDNVRVAVLKIDHEKKRLSLSLKQSTGDPWVGAEAKYPKNELVEGTVISITDFGAFVELEQGVDGLVHISELSNRRVGKVADVLNVGDTKQFRVLENNEEKRKIGLSLKQVEKLDPVKEQEAQLAAQPTVKKIPKHKLKSGLGNVGGMGLGSLSLDDFK